MVPSPPSLLRCFARELRRLRRARGLSVDELARESGLPRMTLEAMEAGRRAPTLAQLVMLSEALGCTADVLVEATTAAWRRGKRR